MSIEKSYDSWAVQYDSNENKTRDLDQRVTIEVLGHYEFRDVLELGCGTGKNTVFLLQKAEHVTGLDFSAEMLARAKAKIDDPRLILRKADLTRDWDIPDQSMDLLTSSLTLEHIEGLDHIFRQAYLKLRTGGLFFVCELHPFRQYLGSKAKYESADGLVELEVYMHHVSDFTGSAARNGFRIGDLREWFDDPSGIDPPRLLSFVFEKV